MADAKDSSGAIGSVELEDYDFDLPKEQIAQTPLAARDAARLLCLDRKTGAVAHRAIRDLPSLLRPGDLLVVNATRVLPARLIGRRASGGAAEALLLGPDGSNDYRALVKISGRVRAGIVFRFGSAGEPDEPAGSESLEPAGNESLEPAGNESLEAEITSVHEGGEVTLRFEDGVDPYAVGHPPLPPYIERSEPDAADRERYQTVFARVPGAIAAPTAGLHLSPELLAEIEQLGVRRVEVVLHVGIGTFRPLRAQDIASGRLHAERYELPEDTARAIAETRARGGRVCAVGTTTTRVLEACATGARTVEPGAGETRLFLRPGDRLQVVDALLTNFHLPRSSLLLLVSAFAGRESILAAYREAVREEYRFFSYGDAMWIA